MPDPLVPQGSEPRAARTEDRPHPEIDWEAAERSPEFRELIRRKRAWVVPATVFFFAWYFGFIILAGYAEGFMGEYLFGDFTVGYALALTQFIMTWGLGWWYLRKADKVFDPLARKAAERAGAVLEETVAATKTEHRFAPDPSAPSTSKEVRP